MNIRLIKKTNFVIIDWSKWNLINWNNEIIINDKIKKLIYKKIL